jgi:hypothetical protein
MRDVVGVLRSVQVLKFDRCPRRAEDLVHIRELSVNLALVHAERMAGMDMFSRSALVDNIAIEPVSSCTRELFPHLSR